MKGGVNLGFWIILDVCIIVTFIFTTLFVPEKYKKNIALFIMCLLTFFSAFRYGVATDYESYETLFYLLQVDNTPKEISFTILVTILRNTGFSAQMMFLVYSFLTGLFIWKGFCYYFKNNQQLLLAVVLYDVTAIFWFESMNGIRQWLAMAIFLWVSKFLLENNFKKFLVAVLIIISVHFGAFVCFIVPWIMKIKLRNYLHMCLIVASFAINYIINLPSMIIAVLTFMVNVIGIGSQYMGYLSDAWLQDSFTRLGGTGLGAMFYIAVYFVVLFILDKNNKLENFVCNMVTVSILIRILLWFSNPLLRLRGFFEMFLLLGTVLAVQKFHKDSQLIISLVFIFAYATVKLGFINQIATAQMVNIEYQMNFNLLQ